MCEAPGVEIVAVVDPARNRSNFAHLPVVDTIEDAGEIDGLILTILANPQAAYDALLLDHPRNQVIVPDLLRVSRLPHDGAHS